MDDHTELPAQVFAALTAQMPPMPLDPNQRDSWRRMLYGEVTAAVEMLAGDARRRMHAAAAEAELLTACHGQEGNDKAALCIRHGTLLDAAKAKTFNRLWLPVLRDSEEHRVGVGAAQEQWRAQGPSNLDLYHSGGRLYEEFGIELYRSPMLDHQAGRGLRVAEAAQTLIGQRVRVYREMVAISNAREIKVALLIEPLAPGYAPTAATAAPPSAAAADTDPLSLLDVCDYASREWDMSRDTVIAEFEAMKLTRGDACASESLELLKQRLGDMAEVAR